MEIQVVVINKTDEVQSFFFATNDTLPNGKIYPSSGYLVGPVKVTLEPDESKSEYISHTIPINCPLGTHTYHGYIGRNSEDHFDIEVTEAVTAAGPEDWETRVGPNFNN
ncbi:MAG: hypothetical protein HF982_11445 [Desulfobacteraceae bacterium]|nr:hypothetical protein [Desulfobacteraceae bacterium]MBC2720180.1 hypothetical protein [Desulfobacteraceae bacterium]